MIALPQGLHLIPALLCQELRSIYYLSIMALGRRYRGKEQFFENNW
jgi:hypothetical protein